VAQPDNETRGDRRNLCCGRIDVIFATHGLRLDRRFEIPKRKSRFTLSVLRALMASVTRRSPRNTENKPDLAAIK
jgi:hypothetical protein